MERRNSSFSTKIIRIGGFIAKIWGGGGNLNPYGRRFTQNASTKRELHSLVLIYSSEAMPHKYISHVRYSVINKQ